MWNKSVYDRLSEKHAFSKGCGGVDRIEKQHASGKLTARERLELLFDRDTFVEVGALVEARGDKPFPSDGVVTGYGYVNGSIVFASSQDFTVNGGTLGENHSQKICRIMDMAIDAMAPFVTINDSGGARIEEGINSLAGYSGIFLRNTRASGVIPQIAVILGPCAGGACYSPAICDFVFMSKETSKMFITGPAVVKAVTGEDVTAENLGGAQIHSAKSGVAHFVYEDDSTCLEGVRKLLKYLPQNNLKKPPFSSCKKVDESAAIENIVPDNMRQAYDVRDVIHTFADNESFFEISCDFAKNIVIGLCRLDGEVIGVVANQPKVFAGALDVDASDKAARFVRFCDCFNIPILSLVDVPGYMPGTMQEHNGIIRHGAKLLYAYSEATVPKVSLIMRKAYGGAYIAMNSKNMGADTVLAWPIAQLAVMGAEGAVDIVHKKQIMSADDPITLRNKLVAEYEHEYLNPYIAAANGYIDEIIEPEKTRERLSQTFFALRSKKKQMLWKKHGNIPL
ncbi:MAG: acyl-CoA carboxylase subunit beta [Clostridia bacterium]|nr:acyl-CoA carboxylase subunit beta [Clostridia bacterium]